MNFFLFLPELTFSFLCIWFVYSFFVPPVPDIGGGSDLFPGPGAGVYPTRFSSFTPLLLSDLCQVTSVIFLNICFKIFVVLL